MKSLLVLMLIGQLIASNVAPLGKYSAAERRHWAFQPRANPEIPALAKSPIDAFILARLQKAGFTASPAASRATLARRVYFDLTGLPPTPEQIKAFVTDKRPDAWMHLVNQLLDSPHYGERWGQHWLDVVRYAESDGFEYDTHRTEAWRYRDYVVRAFQNDKPYDRFLEEQIAGDEIAPAEQELLIASGFNRLGPLRKNAGNQEVASSRNEVLTEMTNAVGAAFLGVTLGCARCHDHKFDPIRQSDYYRMQAYFSGTLENDFPLTPSADRAQWEAIVKPIDAKIKTLNGELAKAKPDEKDAVQKQIDDLEKSKPPVPPTIFAVKNDMAKATPMHLLARGDFANKGDSVSMRPMGVLLADGAPESNETTAPRTKLAKWVTAKDNPLTARVMVNRIWQYHFGKGLVVTANDFGRMGGRPSHPELLDYLANEFVNSGYSVKHIHRLILASNTWQQASDTVNAKAEEQDPENKLLWKFSRRRLDAEEMRDAMLAVSGNLNPKAGGPSVTVPLEKELLVALYAPSQWKVTPDLTEHNRRSLYLLVKRNMHLPMMEVFDAPDGLVSCARRDTSTHAPQALELLNGTFSNQQATAFATRLDKLAGNNLAKKVDHAFLLAAGRLPNPKERAAALEFARTAQPHEFALAILNLNAFMYIN
ncbi:DUF1549 and DUF1553 domain-containing protein [Bryobacter aggregatus]|uniref:DUF1549 and DUF1553 domain-containing protein n=1 Tax=Bryobacter aggregatus TaxID=360054 RepID=UPI00068EB1D2|nr:DUF1549 and DUF1553 domain-containing protein [Bryobacter aggregatus]